MGIASIGLDTIGGFARDQSRSCQHHRDAHRAELPIQAEAEAPRLIGGVDFLTTQQRGEVLLDRAGSVGDHLFDGTGVSTLTQTRKDDLLFVDIHSNVLYAHDLPLRVVCGARTRA